MRTIVNFNAKWAFSKEAAAVPAAIDNKWNFVNLPHSWNAIDGQDGGMSAMGFELNADMMSMMNGFTVLRLFTLMGGMMDVKMTKEQLLGINAQLNMIPKPQK